MRCKITALLETRIAYRFNKPRKPGWTRRRCRRVRKVAASMVQSGTSAAVSRQHVRRHRYVLHTCSLYVTFKAGLAGPVRDCSTRYRRPVTRLYTFSMDLARDPSDRSDPLCEGSREDHHALADCTLTFPISHWLETPLGRRR